MRSLTFVLWAATAGVLSIPENASAQADQTIAMVCQGAFPGQSTITIDLAEKAISEEYRIFSVPVSVAHGTVWKASDSEITFSIESDGYLRWGTLNRQTGIFTIKPLKGFPASTDRLAASVSKASCKVAQPQGAEPLLSSAPASQQELVTAALPDEPVLQTQTATPASSSQQK